jgi:prolipoprotein diacylglyceryl transferase
VFAVWSGGLGIWGAVALAAVVGAWRVRRSGAVIKVFMDAVAPALLVAQAIGRIGNYFNQELFGRPTSLPWGLQIAPQFRPAGYAAYPAFQPTFLYELTFDLALAATLVWLGHHRPIRPPGLFALYVAGYSAFRIFEEWLRIDSSEHFLGLRLNFYIACALTLFGLAWFARTQRTARRAAKEAALLAIGAILCAATAGLRPHRASRPVRRDAGLLHGRPPHQLGRRRRLRCRLPAGGQPDQRIYPPAPLRVPLTLLPR